MKIRAALVMVSALLLSACGLNSVPTAEEAAKAQWANVQVALQRRADLIPNLVETVKASAASEERILTEVTEARARAVAIQVSGDELTDADKMASFNEAQGQLTNALRGLRVTLERYPELKSQQNYATLMDQLEGTENRIAIERRDYNEAVRKYNTTIRTFPSAIGAKIFYGAKPLSPFEAAEGADVVPTVNFGNSN